MSDGDPQILVIENLMVGILKMNKSARVPNWYPIFFWSHGHVGSESKLPLGLFVRWEINTSTKNRRVS